MDFHPLPVLSNSLDEYLTAQIRGNIPKFHKNLDQGKYDANGALIASDYYWNYDGTVILTRQHGTATLAGFVDSALQGLHAQDIYNIVDGNRGAVLFRISGRQTGPFLGLPVQESGFYDVQSAEKFTFNGAALATSVVTVTPTAIMKDQMSGQIDLPTNCTGIALKDNPQTSFQFRELVRKNLASLHLNANGGTANASAMLAVENVEVDENGKISYGREAFLKLITADSAGKGAFPGKLFHDFDVLVDGKQGAIEYVWQAAQQRDYAGIVVKDGSTVRMRGMLFFEVNDDGLIKKAISVFDEGVVERTLTGTGGYLYP